MAYSRRRMPYSLGGDKLEKAKVTPKKYLNPKEEQKLSGDMRELYDRLLPSKESEERRAKFVQKLEDLLSTRWPGSEIKVHVFGSSGNMLCTSDSDVDICITTPTKKLDNMCVLAKALAEHGMERVVCVSHAKVPIVKFWDPELHLACDMNVNNTLALENTRMIKTYVEVDERVRPLAMIIKYWTNRRILNVAALGGTLSSYTWICLIINFLQTRNPPILPVLHQRPHQRRATSSGPVSSFADDIDSLRGFGHENKETLGELLFHFFRRYAHEVDYERNVISVRQGKLISKEEKGWHLLQNNRLCVEEPFNLTRNLGNTADDTSFRGLHIELRRAFVLIAEAQLKECCEQYVFPAEEERIWEKPPPQPRPVLSRSASQSGRGGRGGAGSTRGGRQSNHQFRGPPSSRRASSGASFSKYNPPQSGIPSREYFMQAQQAQYQLHDQLFQHYQMLQAQEQKLRLHLIQQAQAQAQAQVMAQAQDHGQRLGSQQAGTDEHLSTRSNYTDNPAFTPRLRPGMFLYPLQYNPISSTQQGTSTNPSSPSLTPIQLETRRSLHRTSGIGGTPGGSLRSQSQPARSMPSPLALHGFPSSALNPNGSGSYFYVSHGHLNGVASHSNGTSHRFYDRGRSRPMADSPPEDSVPKEYVGYYVGGSPPMDFRRFNSATSPNRAYTDLVYENPGISPALGRLRDTSRSPPHLDHDRHKSEAVQYTPHSAPFPLLAGNLPTQASSCVSHEPLIVDGSNGHNGLKYSTTPTTTSHLVSMSESTSASDDHSYDTPATSSDTQSQELLDPLPLDVIQQHRYQQQLLDLHNKAQIARLNSERIMNGVSSLRTATAIPPAAAIVLQEPLTHGKQVSSHADSFIHSEGSLSLTAAQTVHPRAPLHAASQHVKGSSNAIIENSAIELRHNGAPTTGPLLSPVSEVRAPSPSESWTIDSPKHAKVNGFSDKGKSKLSQEPRPPQIAVPIKGKEDEAEPLSKRANGQQSPAQVKGSPNGSVQINGWQQPAKKNHRKGAKSNATDRPAGSAKAQGEPLPADESQRKGG
ncbi:MAG: hypothetical protein M1830_000888 [Pleopsidium flavum]|nr:MAG: hypothetical protein M1830_000888 [Pleopsidium flavum]